LLGNDTEGSAPIVKVALCEKANGDCTKTSLAVPGVGSYELNANSGEIVFTPEPNFVGTAPAITYVVFDSNNDQASATYTPTVVDEVVPLPPVVVPEPPIAPEPPIVPEPKPTPRPTAKPDLKVGNPNQSVTVSPVANDAKAIAPLVPTTIKLCTTACTLLANQIPDFSGVRSPIETAKGIWTVDAATGNVSFKPNRNWSGRASIGYVMFDELGNPVISSITIVIPPVALPKELAYSGDDPVEPISPLVPVLTTLALLAVLVLRRKVAK
jgi:CshA-type fibril repeat protein